MAEKNWHALSVQQCIRELRSSEKGISSDEAIARLNTFGLNQLVQRKKESPWKLLIGQFKNFLVGILIVAVLVSIVVGEWLDAIAIGFIVVLNAALGFFQEFKAEKEMEALQKMQATKAKAYRNNQLISIDAKELVPGDLISIDEGDKIPADVRIIEAINFSTQEASLTGESTPVEKSIDPVPEKNSVADRKNMAFLNTICVRGRATALVVETGMKTEFGKIAGALQDIPHDVTPLTKKLDRAGKTIGIAILVIAALLFGIIVFLHEASPILALLSAISLAVAAIPEGLPAVVTITLAFGLGEMAKHNAVIRRITAVETLGSTNVICSDKTGTLTQNRMSAKKALVGRQWIELNHALRESDRLMVRCGTYCNSATLGKTPQDSIGDPTEIALLDWGKQNNVFKEERGKLLKEFSFDSDRKRMSVIVEEKGKKIAYCKGAAEGLIENSSTYWNNGKAIALTPADKKFFLAQVNVASQQGLRMLAFAFKEWNPKKESSEKETESKLVFLGLVGLLDDLRPEVKNAIQVCHDAGIDVKMITGDHPLTAKAIALSLGLIRPEQNVVTGNELDALTESEKMQAVNNNSVFARVSPQHKLYIVESLQKSGKVVAVTGDGVNDALALKKADIGIAMGITGTDVAKEASDMIITDDNFASIVRAVQEGRKIYANIQHFIQYLLAANAGEVLFVALCVIALKELPLLPLQLLWINVVTDGLPALALGKEELGHEAMKKKPRNRNESIFAGIQPFVFSTAILLALVAFVGFYAYLPQGIEKARTMAFTIVVLFELLLVFNSRSEKTAFEMNPFSNIPLVLAVLASAFLFWIVLYVPFLAKLFEVVPLSGSDWWTAIALSAIALFVPYAVSATRHVFPEKK